MGRTDPAHRPGDGVLTALTARWDGPVVTALESSGQVRIARRCADLADLLATVASGLGTVALVSADLRGLTLSEVARLRSGGVDVVGLSDPDDETTELRLWQLGVRTVLPADAPVEHLVEAVLTWRGDVNPENDGNRFVDLGLAVGHVAATGTGGPDAWSTGDPSGNGFGAAPEVDVALDQSWAETGSAPILPDADLGTAARGRVIAVWGPAGAPGRTTIAINVAAELALLGRRVLLIDADTYGGAVGQVLSVLDEAPGLIAAARAADQGSLDLSALARLAPELLLGSARTAPRLRLLTGIPKAERWPEIRAAALERVLDVARSLADEVVVDVGFCLENDEELSYDTLAPRRNQATLTTLEVAHELLVVGGCDPVSLQRLVRGLQELGTVRSPGPQVVINRARPGPVGGPPERQVTAALTRFAGITPIAYIPDDTPACDASRYSGRALAEESPDSPTRRAIAELAVTVAGLPGPSPATRPRRRGFTARWG